TATGRPVLTLWTYAMHSGTPEIVCRMTEVPLSPIGFQQRILLVDDFEPWRREVRSQLAVHKRFQIFEAVDGSEAIQKTRTLKPDLILLDIGLPDTNGVEVAKQIRQEGIAVEIVFLTANHDAEVKNAAMATGAKGYLLKTSLVRDLIPTVEAALSNGLSLSKSITSGSSYSSMDITGPSEST